MMNMSARNPSTDENGALGRIIATMPEKGQRVIRSLLDGHTQQETSRITGIPQSVVSYYLKVFRVKAAGALGEC